MNSNRLEFPWRETEKQVIRDVIDSRELSMFSGKYLSKAEDELNSIFQGKNSLLLNSGTAALQLALKISGISSGDEVIVPAITYVATALAIKHVGAIPVFADIDPYNLTLDPSSCKSLISINTKAVIFVHLFGVLGNILEISSLCIENNLLLIEDCAQAFGSEINGKKAGTFGDFSCFSFFESKSISAGEGGALLMPNENYQKIGRKYRHHGMDVLSNDRIVDVEGYNFKPSELESAIIFAQLKHFKEIISIREEVVSLVRNQLKDIYEFQKISNHERPVIDKLCIFFNDIAEREITEKKGAQLGLFRYLKRPLFKEPVFHNYQNKNANNSVNFCNHHLVFQISPYIGINFIKDELLKLGQ